LNNRRLGRSANADDQLPPEVYEAVHGPSIRRRRLVTRAVVLLAVLALVTAGVFSWRDNRSDDNAAQPDNDSQQATNTNSSQDNGQQASQQSPQSNAPLPKPDSQPTTAPGGEAVNTGTVRQPE